MAARILVTDGEQRASLALVRSLGRSGHEVLVVSHESRSIAGASRWCSQALRVPSVLDEPEAYAMAIRDIACRMRPSVVIPTSEASLLALLPVRMELSGAAVPFADVEAFRRISDKRMVIQVAEKLGMAVPGQTLIESPAAASRIELQSIDYPVVIKPSRSVVERDGSRMQVRVEFAATPSELRKQLERFPVSAYPVLVQRRIHGPGIGVFLLLWNGELLATFSHRRLREKPPSGGVSVYAESIALDPHLQQQSESLLRAFSWQGVAMVEYKVDSATATPFLMEVNGRFWGSLQLAIDAGVDFPVLLVNAALGERLVPVTAYRCGIRSRWWWGDVDHLLLRLRYSSEQLDLPAHHPSRLRVALDFLRFGRAYDRSDVFRLSDPAPFVRETGKWVNGALTAR